MYFISIKANRKQVKFHLSLILLYNLSLQMIKVKYTSTLDVSKANKIIIEYCLPDGIISSLVLYK